MKRLRRYALLSIALLSLGLGTGYGYRLFLVLQADPDHRQDTLQTYRGYWLAPEKNIKFSLQAGKRHVRVLLNAALDSALMPQQGISYTEGQYYSLAYRLLAADGTALDERVYYVPLHVRVQNERTRRTLLEHAAIPTETNEIILNFRDTAAASHVELSPGPSALPLAGITVRPYYQERRSDEKLDRIWQRLHTDKKARAARHNVLDVEFLTAEERRNLVRWRWRPLVPVGIEDQDYAVVTLTDEPLDQLDTPWTDQRQRWHLPAGRTANIGLQQPTELLLTAIGADNANIGTEDLHVAWAGRHSYQRQTLAVTATERGSLQVKSVLPPGIVQITAHKGLWLESADQKRNDLLEAQTYVARAYPIDADEQAVFDIHHVGAQPTPVRLNVRTESDSGPSTTLRLRWTDRQGNSRTTVAKVQTKASNLDWIGIDGQQHPISSAASLYLNVPPSTRQLVVTSDQPAWLTAYNRPPRYAKLTQLPEALFGGTDETALRPNWFLLKPQDAAQLDLQGRSAVVRSQLSWPSEADNKNQQISRRLLPQQPTAGTTLLTANDPRREIPASAFSATFAPLVTGTQELALSARASGAETIEPTLLLKQNAEQNASVNIRAQDNSLLSLKLEPLSSGRIRLPQLPTGNQVWNIDAPESVSMWINHAPTRRETWREHTVQTLPAESYTYDISRSTQTSESIAIRVFSRHPGRVTLKVDLPTWGRGFGPYDEWTPQQAIYDLALEPLADTVAPSSGSGPTTWYAGSAFHKLGHDVPSGNLTLEISTLAKALDAAPPADVYLGVTRTTDIPADRAPIRIQRFEVTQR